MVALEQLETPNLYLMFDITLRTAISEQSFLKAICL